MVNSSFFTDGGIYETAVVTPHDTTADTTPSQAPSGFYPDGQQYTQADVEATDAARDEAVAAAAAALASQSAAATSAAAAAVSKTGSDTSAAAALASQNAASTSATNAATSETNALASKNAAATSASNASTSEGNALSYKNAAGTSATNAATSEGNAATSASNAAGSASAAATSASNAAAAVQAAAGTATPLVAGTAAVGTGTKWAHEDHRHPTDTSRAPLNSPALTGVPTAPTPATADNSTTIATTAYVKANLAGAGVSSLNGQTGALNIFDPPQGRLTTVSATPVLTTSQSGRTTLYYTPYQGCFIPIYNGTNMVPTLFSEIAALAFSDVTKNPSAIGATKVNDWFVWNDAGTLRLSHGPDWTNDTTRSAGTALVMVNGILLNSIAITNGPGASRGTYVGTTRSNSSSTYDFVFGSLAAGGGAARFDVWNCYNRVSIATLVQDSVDSWTWNTFSTWRACDTPNTSLPTTPASAQRVSYVCGLSEDGITACNQFMVTNGAASAGHPGIGVDSTTVNSGSSMETAVGATNSVFSSYGGLMQLGYHYLAALEYLAGNTNTVTFYGDNSVATGAYQGGLTVSLRI